MKRRVLLLAGVGMAIAAFAIIAQQPWDQSLDGLVVLGEPVTQDQVSKGQRLYVQNCASCHGIDLEGQADWQRPLDTGRMPAPPHDESGHTWHHSDQDLIAITKGGLGAVVPGYESDMPAFEDILGEPEIRAILAYIKSTWPEREREFQATVTRNDQSEPGP